MWPKDNPDSWRMIHDSIAEYPNDNHWTSWKRMATGLLSELESRGLGQLFRIGQGMHHIIFSTADHHKLTNEPRVTLELHPEEEMVRVAYGCTNLSFHPPLSEERVSPSAAVPTILGYLRRLWIETKPDKEMPDALHTG
jgi:hypothetical protein